MRRLIAALAWSLIIAAAVGVLAFMAAGIIWPFIS